MAVSVKYIVGKLPRENRGDEGMKALIIAASNDISEPYRGGIDREIYTKADTQKLKEARNEAINKLPKSGITDPLTGKEQLAPGTVFITPAFGLKGYDYIVHTVPLKYMGYNADLAKQILVDCYKKAVELAIDKKCKTIDTPVLGSSPVLGFSDEISKTLAEKAVSLIECDSDITLVVVSLSGKEKESRKHEKPDYKISELAYIALDQSIINALVQGQATYDDFVVIFEEYYNIDGISISYSIKRMNELCSMSCGELLNDLMDKRGLSGNELSDKSNGIISHTTINRIRNCETKSPSRETLIWISVLLKLNSSEAEFFIKKGSNGEQFPAYKHEDESYVASCIMDENYDIEKIMKDISKQWPKSKLLMNYGKRKSKTLEENELA